RRASVVTEDHWRVGGRPASSIVTRGSRPAAIRTSGSKSSRACDARLCDTLKLASATLPQERGERPTATCASREPYRLERPCNPAQAVATTVDFPHGFQTTAT